MEHVSCNLCGSYDYRLVYTMPDKKFFPNEWFQVVECLHCGLGYVNPRPHEDEMWKYYPHDGYYSYHTEEDSKYHKKRYQKQASYLSSLPVMKRSILDVGCAHGDFPLLMNQMGWEAEGLELNPNVETRDGVNVYRCDLDTLASYGKKYEVITLWSVLEHLHDPMKCLKTIHSLLNQRGFLLLLVPNFSSLASRELFMEDVPRHLYFFTKSNIRQYFSMIGFNLLKTTVGKGFSVLKPYNLIIYYWMRLFENRKLEFADIRKSRRLYFRERGKKFMDVWAQLQYIKDYPLSIVEGTITPIIEHIQALRGTYGTVIYLARKL